MANDGRYLARPRMQFPLMFEPALLAETGDFVAAAVVPGDGWVLPHASFVWVLEHQPEVWVMGDGNG